MVNPSIAGIWGEHVRQQIPVDHPRLVWAFLVGAGAYRGQLIPLSPQESTCCHGGLHGCGLWTPELQADQDHLRKGQCLCLFISAPKSPLIILSDYVGKKCPLLCDLWASHLLNGNSHCMPTTKLGSSSRVRVFRLLIAQCTCKRWSCDFYSTNYKCCLWDSAMVLSYACQIGNIMSQSHWCSCQPIEEKL